MKPPYAATLATVGKQRNFAERLLIATEKQQNNHQKTSGHRGS